MACWSDGAGPARLWRMVELGISGKWAFQVMPPLDTRRTQHSPVTRRNARLFTRNDTPFGEFEGKPARLSVWNNAIRVFDFPSLGQATEFRVDRSVGYLVGAALVSNVRQQRANSAKSC